MKFDTELDFHTLQNSDNLVEQLSESDLKKIGEQVCKGYQIDYDSVEPRRDVLARSLLIAKQIKERKSTPWEGASDVKHPLVMQAVISSAA